MVPAGNKAKRLLSVNHTITESSLSSLSYISKYPYTYCNYVLYYIDKKICRKSFLLFCNLLLHVHPFNSFTYPRVFFDTTYSYSPSPQICYYCCYYYYVILQLSHKEFLMTRYSSWVSYNQQPRAKRLLSPYMSKTFLSIPSCSQEG